MDPRLHEDLRQNAQQAARRHPAVLEAAVHEGSRGLAWRIALVNAGAILAGVLSIGAIGWFASAGSTDGDANPPIPDHSDSSSPSPTPTTSGPPAFPVVTSISIRPATSALDEGETGRLRAVATYDDGHHDMLTTVTWVSDDEDVATVDDGGVVTAVGTGTASITATYDEDDTIEGNATVTVTPAEPPPDAALLGLTMTPSHLDVVVGKSGTLSVTGSYDDGTTQPVTERLTWKSSRPAVARVGDGDVEALTAGTTTITATDGVFSATATVTVREKQKPGEAIVTGIMIDPQQLFLDVDETATISVTASYDDDSSEVVTDGVDWKSSDGAVATVAAGTVTAAGPGKASIRASFGGFSDTAIVTVAKPTLQSIALSPNPLALLQGDSATLTAQGTYSDGSTAPLTGLQWSSGETKTAQVVDGKVTGVTPGTTTITAKADNGASASVNVTVTKKLQSISVNPTPLQLCSPNTRQMTATAKYSDGSTQTVTTTAKWSSSNTSVATVSATGLVTPKTTANGSTNIAATFDGVTGTAVVSCFPPG